ncbi:MAG: DUF5050 domain-containing protein, partial [Clostridia bacterium]
MKKLRPTCQCLVCFILIGLMFTACSTPASPTAPTASTNETILPTNIPTATPSATATAVTPDLKGIGNTFSNMINNGTIASKDGWVFYNSAPFSKINESALYKAKVDGSARMKLTDDSPWFINVVGEWVFYVNGSDEHTVYRIKTDGTSREKLNEKAVWSMIVVDNWVYYTQQYSPGKFKKMKVDGSETTVIGDDDPELLAYANEWIYYFNNEDDCLYKMKTDGSGRMKLTEGEATYFTVEGDWLYYALYGVKTLNRVKTDGSGKVKLADDFKGGFLFVQGDLLYYISNGAFYSMNLDGIGSVQIFKDRRGSPSTRQSDAICTSRFSVSPKPMHRSSRSSIRSSFSPTGPTW